MKKGVCYAVDICINVHAAMYAQECAAGVGLGPNAHCKQVVSILFCLVTFFETGNLLTEMTCTQKLQSINKANKFIGSPVKMEKHPFSKRKNKNAELHLQNLRFDPKPQRTGYND